MFCIWHCAWTILCGPKCSVLWTIVAGLECVVREQITRLVVQVSSLSIIIYNYCQIFVHQCFVFGTTLGPFRVCMCAYEKNTDYTCPISIGMSSFRGATLCCVCKRFCSKKNAICSGCGKYCHQKCRQTIF